MTKMSGVLGILSRFGLSCFNLLRMALAVTVLVGLSACSKGPDGTPLEVELVQNLRQSIKKRRQPEVERAPVTRAALDATVKGAFIEVTIEETEVFAYLSQQLIKHDDFPGEVVVWRSEDNVILAMRDGVLVGSRGLRNNLLSASALVQVGGVKGPSGQGQRLFEVAALDNESVTFALACEVVDLGAETIEIVELSYTTRHLQERCEGSDGRVVNDYWMDSRSGHIWQSRQWAGPEVGYLRIRQLTI